MGEGVLEFFKQDSWQELGLFKEIAIKISSVVHVLDTSFSSHTRRNRTIFWSISNFVQELVAIPG